MPGEPWAPGLDEVARHIPRRTRDSRTPGSDKMLGTFTDSTTPNAGQAQAFIDAAVRIIVADVGPLPTAGAATLIAGLQASARDAAEWRAAADIEIAYPNREADVHVARDLDARAKDALAMLKQSLQEAGAGLVEDLPSWSAPDPVWYGDRVDL